MSGERRQHDTPDTARSAREPDLPEEAGSREEGGGTAEAHAAQEPAEAAPAEVVEVVAAEAARQERDEYLDMLRRVQADFENYKKRMVRQQTELLDRAAEGLVVKLLPVLDAFDLVRAHLESEGSPADKALLQALGLLSDTLGKEGLERLDDLGAVFDPTRHEAVEHQPAGSGADSEHEEEGAAAEPVVSDVLRAGYRYRGKVIRPAMVKVRG